MHTKTKCQLVTFLTKEYISPGKISTHLFNNLTLVGAEGDPNGVCECTGICGVAGCEQALHELGQPRVWSAGVL